MAPPPLEVTRTALPGVLVLAPRVFRDDRGFFVETWNERAFREAGIDASFVQDNHSQSRRHVLRGIHYQLQQPQGKLVRCASGAVFDVAVDLRRGSPQFGRWTGVELTGENHRMLWIPPGFGHAFLTLSETADVLYKATAFYDAASDRAVRWNDPDLAIDWPLSAARPVLSDKDARGALLRDAELYA